MFILISYPLHASSWRFAFYVGTGKRGRSWLWDRACFVLLFGVSFFFFFYPVRNRLRALLPLYVGFLVPGLSKGSIINLHLLTWRLHMQTAYSNLKSVWQVNSWGGVLFLISWYLSDFVILHNFFFFPLLNEQIYNAPWHYYFLTLIRRASVCLNSEDNLYTYSLVNRKGKRETCVYLKGRVLPAKYTQSLKRCMGAADGWTLPCAEGARGEIKKSCPDNRPPWAGIYPASGPPRTAHRPPRADQATWSASHNLAADGFTVFSKAFVFLKIKAKGVIQCLEMTQRTAKAALFLQTVWTMC